MPKSFIFIGRSGSGKGTQADFLKKYLAVKYPKTAIMYMYTGDKVREYVEGDSHAQKLARDIYEAGGRQPDFLAIYLWSQTLLHEIQGREHLMFDGTPRSLLEAQALDTAFDFLNHKYVFILFIDVSRDWAMERLLARKRDDDNAQEINRRLDWYEKDVYPAVEYYKKHPAHTFLNINGEQSIEEVHKEIVSKLQTQ